MRVLVAAVQFEPDQFDKPASRERLGRLVESAAARGARLIVTPELGCSGMCWYSREEAAPLAETAPGPFTRMAEELCRRHRCYLVAGMLEVEPATGVFYNSAVLVGPGGLLGVYRKNHLFISDLRWAAAGNRGMPVVETEIGRIGIAICADLEFPESVRVLALKGAQVVCCPTGWLGEKGPAATWITRAWENRVFLVAADRWGRERGIQFAGGSCVIGTDGEIIACRDSGDGVVLAEIDLDEAGRGDGRRPELYQRLALDSYRWPPRLFFSLYGRQPLPGGNRSAAGVLQLPPVPGGWRERLAEVARGVRLGIESHPDLKLLVLPDLGAAAGPDQAIELGGPEMGSMVELGRRHGIYLVLGVLERSGGDLYRTAVLCGPPGVVGFYRQVHRPAAPAPAEVRVGDSLDLFFDTPLGRIGLLLGEDLRYPEAARCLALAGCDLICVAGDGRLPLPRGLGSTRIPHPGGVPSGEDPYHWCLGRSRAWENGCYLAVANPAVDPEGAVHGYGSGVFDPLAYRRVPPPEEVITHGGEGLLVRVISTREEDRAGREVRQKEVLRRRRTDLYTLLVK
ncbi:MAG: nitrilase-related carbon-nitrogen hydrolase [Syntrophomonadaceae bacterium]|nr:nitrilase-related carbon-nitrogen hydrolase [Syntrophomonadaceae bacterium]